MKTILHTSDSRGQANHGWLNARHSFSFAGYHDPGRVHFGALRVLNDDAVAAFSGFGTHPHDNMEIITIPLEGQLQHRDSMGNEGVITKGEVQVMSAGTGIQHSEKNVSGETLKLLQIWVFPNQKNVTPRYDQRAFDLDASVNQLVNVVSPMGKGEGLQIHQDAWFYLGKLEKGKKLNYELQDPAHGVYAFVIEGSVSINGQEMGRRDGAGITEADRLQIEAKEDAELLLMEVPL